MSGGGRLRSLRGALALLGLIAVVTGVRSTLTGLEGVSAVAERASIELDNNLRFVSAIWAALGLALLLCVRDPGARRPELRVLLWLTFAGGLGRLVAFALHGLPGPPYWGIVASELLAPLLLLLLPRRTE